MAEAVVSTALETLRDLLVDEARFLYGVGDEVRQLEIQLKEMKCFLEDADRRRHESKTIFNWISEIKDLLYRAETAIERHAAHQVSSRRSRRGLRQLIRRYSCILEEWYSLHQLGSEISQIKSDLGRITSDMRAYGIKNIIDHGESSSINNRARKSFPEFEIGDCFVGKEDELKQLVHLLGQDNEDRVISVWGMGGSGKTTIAKKLYNETKTSFDRSAWVCITQQCQSFQSVWKDVLKQLEHPSRKVVSDEPQQIKEDDPQIREDLSESELNERLCKIQREKRCLIVLDDLWKVSDWNELKHPFLVHGLHSKILITTREQEVAEIGCPVKVGLLKEEDALELLKMKAFPQANIPEFALEENFEKIGKEMVQKCGYLPLAISLLSGVLRKKNSMMEWELVKEFIYRDEKEIDGVLNLSYESLPYYLKPCFLYMGIFQEDETINPRELYRMWIAQDMISYENIGDKDKALMEIAELYLGELVSRSIVQVEIHYDDGVTSGRKYRSCKLHDVVRELCLKLGRSEDFGVQSLEYQSGKASSHRKIRHLAIHFRKEVQVEPDELTVTWGEDSSEHLRSLQMFNHINSGVVVEFPPQGIVDFQKFKLLRDLVMVGFKFEGRKLSKGITSLVHLRHLRLEKCEFDKLPSSIRNLIYMDTLDLTDSMNVGVPNVFEEMVRLKQLFLPHYDEEKIGNYRLTLDEGVIELETLSNLDSRVHDLKCMNRMKNLRSFRTKIHDNESLSASIDAIALMEKLLYCLVEIKKGCELGTNEGVLTLKKVITCPNLHSLSIQVKLGKALAECESDFFSSKLITLVLSECEIEDDPMSILGNLPCLIRLSLGWKAFVGEEMTCPSNSFRCLKRLELSELPKLREWRVEAGAMPLLSELEIYDCSSLKMLPDGLSGISNLRKLEITGMAEMGKRVSASGEDFHKVSHVPSIIILD